ncbi:efflux RND transporter permease subunit [soil metagenome]
MWIVELALRRPYTFVVVSMLIAILGILAITRMAVDIFPTIDVPVVSVIWQYTGLPAEDMEARIMTISERAMTTVTSDIDHMESNSITGLGIIKVYLRKGADVGKVVGLMSAVNQTVLKVLPPGITPPLISAFSASDVPVLQLGVGSKTLTEAEIFDYDLNFIRTRLASVGGASVPLPFGGKQRLVMVDIDPEKLFAKKLSPNDVVAALNLQNLILPSGSAKMGSREYPVKMNSSPAEIETLNDYPIKQVNNAMIYLKDVGFVHDGFSVQTNIVNQNGHRSTLLNILRSGGASTLSVVQNVKDTLPALKQTLPKELDIEILTDQSLFVRAAVKQVVIEALTAAALIALLILAILGSWRSTLIVSISIPLSILASIIGLSMLHETLNTMTLGGLSLAVGMLVDDATVEIENIHRNFAMNKPITEAILDAASQIAAPAFVSTISICIVFVPVAFLTEPARSLFVPLALAVVIAMLASYFLSRTLVPVMSKYLLPAEHPSSAHLRKAPGIFAKIHQFIDSGFSKLRDIYHHTLDVALAQRKLTVLCFCSFYAFSFCLVPYIGMDFFPAVDGGQMRLHVVAPTGTRIEETERIFNRVEAAIRKIIPPEEVKVISQNIGIPNSGINLSYGDNATFSNFDGEILITLTPEHKNIFERQKEIRRMLHSEFPRLTFFFQSADITSQILNAGLPAPIDVQITGRNKVANYNLAVEMRKDLAKLPGAVDVVIHQVPHQPQLNVDVDRTKAMQLGLTQRDIAGSVLTALSSSFQTAPSYWVNPKNGVNYLVAVQTPQSKISTTDELGRTAIMSTKLNEPQLLTNLGSIHRSTTSAIISHYAIQPVFDIYISAQDTDLGNLSAEVNKVVEKYRNAPKKLVRGSFIKVRGQADSMNSAFFGLLSGLIFALVLIYLLLVVNFQSWIDPLIILMAIPGAFSGILWCLFVTETTFSVPALMGAIMSIGVASANSILMVTFANEGLHEGDSPIEAASQAGFTRFRPVIMTASAMIIGMLPMATGLGEGGSQNAPLGRSVIGGLLVATIATLLFVPVMFSLLKKIKKTDTPQILATSGAPHER